MRYLTLLCICAFGVSACSGASTTSGEVTPPDPLESLPEVTALQTDVRDALATIDPDSEVITPLSGDALFIGVFEAEMAEDVSTDGGNVAFDATVRGEARVAFDLNDSTLEVSVPTFYDVATGEAVGNLEIPSFEITPDADQRFESGVIRGPLEVNGGGFVGFEPTDVELVLEGGIGQSETLDRGVLTGFLNMKDEFDVARPGEDRHVIFFEGGVQALEVE